MSDSNQYIGAEHVDGCITFPRAFCKALKQGADFIDTDVDRMMARYVLMFSPEEKVKFFNKLDLVESHMSAIRRCKTVDMLHALCGRNYTVAREIYYVIHYDIIKVYLASR